MGILTDANADRLRASGAPTLWQACVASGLTTHATILTGLSLAFDLALGKRQHLDPASRQYLAESLAREHGVAPLRMVGRLLEIGCTNPLDAELERKLGFAAGHRVKLVLLDPDSIASALDTLYPRAEVADQLVHSVGPLGDGEGVLREVEALADGDLPRVTTAQLVDALLVQAIRRRASDVHLEPHERTLGVRYRIDGCMHEIAQLPKAVQAPVTSRMKILANLDIADRIRPQDGRAQIHLGGTTIDLRISTLPVGNLGEKTVIRILDAGKNLLDFSALGLLPDEMLRIDHVLAANEGMVLVTGPTGCGKTTTLYTALRTIQSRGVNIVTVEDPIEYRLDGVSQVQTNERAGLTFASVLRSILRQDPDVVLVGEIRDRETAEVAIQASLTGHLVLSTLHTNDAPSTIMRLVDLGVDASSLSAALRAVIAQRLLRRICTACRRRIDLSALAASQRALLTGLSQTDLYDAVGCSECNGVGYRGRLVVPEIAMITPDIERAIADGANLNEIMELCRAGGMRTLWEGGLQRVALGLTTLNELLDTITPPMQVTAALQANVSTSMQPDVDAIFSAARAPAARPPVALVRPETPVPHPPTPASTQSRQPRVLIADDDKQARQELRDGLQREGFRVLEVGDGEAVIEYVKRLSPDLVLAELTLPKLDGLGVLRELVNQDLATPTIILTNQDDPELALWAIELGAIDVLIKPIDARALAQRLRILLDRAAA